MPDCKPGTLVFAHTSDAIGWAIRLGEWLRWRKGDHWNHVAIIDRVDNGVPYVTQAAFGGVTDTAPLASLGDYELVELPEYVQASDVLYFSRKQVGDEYGWGTILALAFDIITPSWFPTLRPAKKGRPSWICSALVGESLRFGGWYHPWPDPMMVTPAQLYDALTC